MIGRKRRPVAVSQRSFRLIGRSIESWLQIIMLQPQIMLRRRNPRVADDHPPPDSNQSKETHRSGFFKLKLPIDRHNKENLPLLVSNSLRRYHFFNQPSTTLTSVDFTQMVGTSVSARRHAWRGRRIHPDRADHREGGDPLEQAVAMVQELLVGRPFVPCHDQHPLDQAAEDGEKREQQGEVRREQHLHPPFIGQLPKRGRDQERQEEPADPADGERARDMARVGQWVKSRVDGADPKRDQGEGSCPGEGRMDAVALKSCRKPNAVNPQRTPVTTEPMLKSSGHRESADPSVLASWLRKL